MDYAWKEAKEEAKKLDMIFIPAIEIKTLSGHLIGLGLTEFVPSLLDLEETIDRIHEQGAIAVAPHPYDIKGDGIREGIKHVDAVEVFNPYNMDRISNKLAVKTAKKLGKPMVVGSDAHTVNMLGRCLNEINAWDVDSVLKEIMKNRVKLSVGYFSMDILVDWVKKRFELSEWYVLDYIDNNYSPLKSWVSKRMLHRFLHSKNPINKFIWKSMGYTGLTASVFYSFLTNQKTNI
ncbi:MAG: hypothetical protein DRP15_00400 [Candidatus Aenigmatarchaeota archaeon]|nr:MAG: hypothetical protein DRP15_00400 [Candidatus Aenigmarchaeota archaeon]